MSNYITHVQEEFRIQALSNFEVNDAPWRQLLSVLQSENLKKRSQLVPPVSIDEEKPKFTRLPKNIDNIIVLESEKSRSLNVQLKELVKSSLIMRREVNDIKILLERIDNDGDRVQIGNQALQMEVNHFSAEISKGDQIIAKEGQFLNREISLLKDEESKTKNSLNQFLQKYQKLQTHLMIKNNLLHSTLKDIQLLDYELEMKRLAKIDSQLLLLEVEAVQMLAQVFLGNLQLTNQDFWMQTGRQLVIENLKKRTKFGDFTELYDMLEFFNFELTKQQFSLQKFLQRLSEFFNFCGQNVLNIVTNLQKVYHFEELYEASLKTRFTDLTQRCQQLKLTYQNQEKLLLELQRNDQQSQRLDNFANILDVNQFQSLNLMSPVSFERDRIKANNVNAIIWGVMQFLTNGLSRWVGIINTLNKLVDKNEHPTTETFTLFRSSNQIKFILDKYSLSEAQKDHLFSYLKNDFIFYNWGSDEYFETLLSNQMEIFESKQYPEDARILYMISSFDLLTQNAYENFQKIFLEFLKKFIKFLIDLRQMSQQDSVKLCNQRRQSLRKESFSYDDQARKSIGYSGLFGQNLNYIRETSRKKCEQIQNLRNFKFDDFDIKQEQLNFESEYRQTRRNNQKLLSLHSSRKELLSRNYQEVSQRSKNWQEQVHSLVDLNKRIMKAASLQYKRKNLNCNTIRSLHEAYSGFHSKQLFRKIEVKQQSIPIPMPDILSCRNEARQNSFISGTQTVDTFDFVRQKSRII